MTNDIFTASTKVVDPKSLTKTPPANNNGHEKTVEQFLVEAGIDNLQDTSTPEQFMEALNNFVALTANKDAVWKGFAKNELVKKLKEAKVQGATEVVTKAYGKNEASPTLF